MPNFCRVSEHMASKKRNLEIGAPILSGFTQLFLRKLQANIERKNENPGRHVVIKKLKSVYAYEIGCMMHTLGDAECPLKNSILYLETVLRDQMNLLLIKASEIPGYEALTHEPLLTLLANNREKVNRLLHYLFLKDSSELLGKRKYDQFVDVVNSAQFGPRVDTCLEFLQSIDAGDYDPEAIKIASDDIALERVARKFQMSRSMSNEQYLLFSKKQRVCFYPKGDGSKFKDWLLYDNVTDLQPTAIALDIMAFFARETIAEVVEACLLIGQSKNLLNVDIPSGHLNYNSQSIVNQPETFTDSNLDVPGSPFHNSGMRGLSNFIADCTDSNSDISSLLNSGALGMLDIFALSTSSLYEKDTFFPAEESLCSKKGVTETMHLSPESNDEKVIAESTSASETRTISNVPEPKILARNRNDPISVKDLKSAVMDLIMSSPGKIHMNKTKRILCL